jgi:hypothetical protein
MSGSKISGLPPVLEGATVGKSETKSSRFRRSDD